MTTSNERVMKAVLICLTTTASMDHVGADATWKGERVQQDGVICVKNPAQAMQPPQFYSLEPVWQIDSETESGLVLGAVERVCRDSTGSFYLLDVVLRTIHVISSDGKYLRSVARAGEGPGELQAPMDIHLDDKNNLLIVDASPPRLVVFDISGALQSEWQPHLPEGSRAAMYRGLPCPLGYVLSLHVWEQRGGASRERMSVELCRRERDHRVTLAERVSEQPRGGQPCHDEAASETFYCVDVSPAGSIYLAPDFAEYRICIFGPDGSKRMIIERECVHVPRTAEQLADTEAYWRKVYERWSHPTIRLQKNERCVQDIHAMEGDSLWVETAHGWYDNPEGIAVVLDTFDAEGRYVCQRVYLGNISPWDDHVFFFKDCVVLATMAAETGRGASGGDADHGEDSPAPKLICFRTTLNEDR